MDIFGYVRVSTPRQVKTPGGIDAQKDMIEKWCDLHKHNLLKIYSDPGRSTIGKRPQYEKLIKALENGEANGVVVQLEVFENFSFARNAFWALNPWHPEMNVNYGSDVISSESERADIAMYKALSENRTDVLRLLEHYVATLVFETMNYSHVIYSVSNESNAPLEWAEYWANFIHRLASSRGFDLLVGEMPHAGGPDGVEYADTDRAEHVERQQRREVRRHADAAQAHRGHDQAGSAKETRVGMVAYPGRQGLAQSRADRADAQQPRRLGWIELTAHFQDAQQRGNEGRVRIDRRVGAHERQQPQLHRGGSRRHRQARRGRSRHDEA